MFNPLVFLLLLLSYFLGSIPFGLICSKYSGVDIRKHGSGNIGATNVFRVMGWKWGVFVFFLDFLKGFLPTFFMVLYYPSFDILHILIGFIAILGHIYTVFASFKGGKGVATAAGMIMALDPIIFLITFVIFIIGFSITRMVAPFSVLCSISVPILFYFFKSPKSYFIFVTCISILIIYHHRSNIKRLLKGKENRF
ncbi:acyl-phosphate glycerol 3-phosphate acyltransferase [Candidatus Marinamargulisbacteria bacterium SCGC AG-410-N11]|nr:acyl-phosphate glycerol 3-phosphate acyltransferase [Candidatus Marinamargulisbacteria bacterium SCGC AG-410-N11]